MQFYPLKIVSEKMTATLKVIVLKPCVFVADFLITIPYKELVKFVHLVHVSFVTNYNSLHHINSELVVVTTYILWFGIHTYNM